ncbi:hypothetical protein EJM73_08990 [Clostridium botulinum]|uniref:hypothetical protein n=1 Tax=Clostridium botulinum TaxID=1491 RepID=UPI001375CC2D|nr:hypothetical protein [Clostridium botulinum]NCI19760.1 hypothetical protein [Clostridium botulinum]NCI35798.1 hypothetical protein [Clostridium botulinum]NCI71655.1 hypothetical protein [Clostridium botulinum]NDI38847.1 hypothetical protein [Clostridium botulinum]
MIALYKLKKEIINKLNEKEIIVNFIKIKGFDKDTGKIRCIFISLSDIHNVDNILYEIKSVLDETENEFDVCILQKLLEF